MGIEVLAPAMKRIVREGQEPALLASGFGGPVGPAEGPVWFREGKYLLFSDIHGDRRMRWTAENGATLDHQGTQNGNGQTRDREGRLVVCHHFSRRVDRLEADGSVTGIADSYRGLKLNRPNDVVVKSDGAIYFTDPPPKAPFTPIEHMPELDIAGVYRVSPDLKHMNMIVRDLVNPNGLCFSPDESILYINDSNKHRKLIMAYDVEANGTVDLGSARLFCDMRSDERPGGPDGMKVDVEGNLYCTGPAGIWVMSAKGERLGIINFPERCSNLAWGGDDWTTLFVTTVKSLYSIQLGIPGVPVPRGDIRG